MRQQRCNPFHGLLSVQALEFQVTQTIGGNIYTDLSEGQGFVWSGEDKRHVGKRAVIWTKKKLHAKYGERIQLSSSLLFECSEEEMEYRCASFICPEIKPDLDSIPTQVRPYVCKQWWHIGQTKQMKWKYKHIAITLWPYKRTECLLTAGQLCESCNNSQTKCPQLTPLSMQKSWGPTLWKRPWMWEGSWASMAGIVFGSPPTASSCLWASLRFGWEWHAGRLQMSPMDEQEAIVVYWEASRFVKVCNVSLFHVFKALPV